MRLFIGNLSTEVTQEDLQQACEAFGEVTLAEIAVEDDGQSKGFGFVEMANKEASQSALAGLNGKEIKGLALKVSEARLDRKAFNKGASQGGFQTGKGSLNQRGPGASKAAGSKGGFTTAKGSSSKV